MNLSGSGKSFRATYYVAQRVGLRVWNIHGLKDLIILSSV